MTKPVSIFLIFFNILFSQVAVDVTWTPYVTYYLSMFDINTGESNMPIFLAELRRESNAPETVNISVEFEIIIDSDVLGVNNQTLAKVETIEPLPITAPVRLSNMDLNLSTDQIFDDLGQPLPLSIAITEKIDAGEMEEMFNAIVQTGRLPDGIYTFRIIITTEDGQQIIEEDILNISNPSMHQLITPGGSLADTSINEVYTPFPIFQWESDPCNIASDCEYFIRVAEYNPLEHSSIDQAIESVTRLPLNQSQGYESVGFGVTTFQYPTDAGDLEPGKIYVWQVKKDLITTSGTEELLSNILVFKIKDFSPPESQSAQNNITPTHMALRSLIGDDMSDQIFGSGGQVEGALANGNITLNGDAIDISFVQSLISMGVSIIDEDGNENFRPLEILSVEVSE
tara:strand:- start:3716 stop:4912 length:1197 start_codon:yes stop_codon:yes gene_type:complete